MSFWQRAEALCSRPCGIMLVTLQMEDGFNGNSSPTMPNEALPFIDLCQKRFDVVLMNPPFGEGSEQLRAPTYTSIYPRSKVDLYAAFMECGHGMLFDRPVRCRPINLATGFFQLIVAELA